jgi:hypothetical protein
MEVLGRNKHGLRFTGVALEVREISSLMKRGGYCAIRLSLVYGWLCVSYSLM